MDVTVEPQVLERHPDYVAVVVAAEGVRGGPSDDASSAALDAAAAHVLERGLARAADHEHVAAWRSAFSAFGAKPSKYNCSAEALIARVLKGGPSGLPRVNALVDLYNAVSVRWVIPVGGEDLDALSGPLRLAVADGGEVFDGGDPPAPGEIVWRDDTGVTCRRWNWRQGRRTALTEETTRAFFVFDRLAPMALDDLDAAVADLCDALRERTPDATFTTFRLAASP